MKRLFGLLVLLLLSGLLLLLYGMLVLVLVLLMLCALACDIGCWWVAWATPWLGNRCTYGRHIWLQFLMGGVCCWKLRLANQQSFKMRQTA